MKNKWLIGLLTVALAVTTCLGIVACGGGADDAEIAKKAIDTVNVLYGDAEKNTPDDYQVIGVTKVDDETYTIDWSVSPDSAKEYAKVGALDESSKMVTIDITRTTADVEYTLKASVTVGEATESVEFARKIPKKSSEESVTATLDFSAKDNRTTYDSDNNEQVWKQNGITLTNTGNVGDYTNPVRLYKNTTVSIEMENARIIHIDFHSAQGYDDSPYPEYLKTSLENSDLPIKGDITVSEDGLTLGVDFETPQEVVTFKTTAGQCRLTSIDVEAIERSADEHVHNWTYEHIANTWTHKATCTAEGCDVKTKTEDCTPKLNVCACGYTYTAKEIVDALFALGKDESLRGTYTLTGVITKVTEVDTNTYKNATFEMTVEGQTVTVYRAKGSHYAEVAVGGTATVNGELLDYNGTKEFTQGASVVEFVPGVDERTPDQKADAALEKLAATLTVSKTGETVLPVSSEAGVTFTWATSATLPKGTAFEGGKLTVTALPAADTAIEFTVTATIEGATQTHTKTVTVTIKAEGSETTNYGTAENPLTVSEVIALAGTIDGNDYLGGADTPIQIYAKGIVVKVAGWSSQYNNWTDVYIAEKADAASSEQVQVYRLELDSQYLKTQDDLVVGATITLCGWLQAYNGKAEISYNKATNANVTAVAYDKSTVSTEPEPDIPEDGTKVTTVVSEYAASHSWANSERYETIELDGNVSVTVNGTQVGSYGLNSGKYYTSGGGAWRIYQNEHPTIVFAGGNGVTILSIKITYDSDKTGVLTSADGTTQYLSDALIEVNAATITFSVGNTDSSVTNGQARITAIEVIYKGGSSSQPSHVHNYTYTHTQGAWTHTGTCSVSGCDQPTITEDCTPELNVCKKCTYTYTQDEILEKLFALDDGAEMSGTYQLTGVVKADATAGTSGDWKFDMTVGERTVQAYYVKHEGLTDLPKAGDTVTVTGPLKRYGSTYEFNGGNLIKVTSGSAEPEPTPAPQGDLSLTSENLFAGVEGNGYASYNGEHSVDGYTVDTNQVMGNSYTSASYKVLQFQASKGTLTVEGNFSKITLIIVATSSFDELALPQVKAGENVLEAKLVKTETPEGVTVKSGDDNLPVYLYTVEYTVTGTGVQTITIAKTTKLALYLTSIKFTAAADAPAALLPGKND